MKTEAKTDRNKLAWPQAKEKRLAAAEAKTNL